MLNGGLFVIMISFLYLYWMKKSQKTDIAGMIMGAHYLNALDKEALVSKPLSEMERQDYISQINSLKEALEQFKEMNTLLRKAFISSEQGHEHAHKQNESLQSTISGLSQEIGLLRAEVSKQPDYNKRHNKMSFGKKSLSSSSNQEEKKSREEEKMDDDGSPKGMNAGSGTSGIEESSSLSSAGESSSLDQTKVKSEHLDKERGPRGPYTLMEAARIILLKTILEGIPSDMKFIGYKTIEEYNRISYVECTCYEVGVYEDTYGIRHEFYNPENPDDTRRPRTNVVKGTPCTPEFMSDMIVNRWMIHTPNHRENIRMRIEKFTSSENSRNSWMKMGAKWLQPLCIYFKEKILKRKSVLNIDETWCRVRIKYKGDGTMLGKYYKKYIWVLVNKIEKLVYFLYDNDEDDSRGQRPITEFLDDFKGTIQSDGYVVYKHLSRSNPENVHLLCWAHVRAKFKYAAEISSDEDAKWFVE